MASVATLGSLSEIEAKITLVQDIFGYKTNLSTGISEPIARFTWKNTNEMSVSVMTYGATVLNIVVPSKNGEPEDVLLGFDKIEDYEKYENYMFGNTIGRVANIITDAEYFLKECEYINLSRNHNDKHHKDGGFIALSRVNWTPHVDGVNLILSHLSNDNDEGYPGNLMIQIMMTITENNCFHVSYHAMTDRKTPVNISNRLYFNLAGHDKGHVELYRHVVHINGSKYVDLDEDQIPTGKIELTGGTCHDFRVPQVLGTIMTGMPKYEFHECLMMKTDKEKPLVFNARIIHPDAGRVLEIYSNQRCIEMHTCNNFPDPYDEISPVQDHCSFCSSNSTIIQASIEPPIIWIEPNEMYIEPPRPTPKDLLNEVLDKIIWLRTHEEDTNVAMNEARRLLNQICKRLKEIEEMEQLDEEEISEEEASTIEQPIFGKNNAVYMKNAGFCIQTEHIPNGIQSRHRFPDIILKPGREYVHNIVYKFGIHIGNPMYFEDGTLEVVWNKDSP